MNNHWCPLPWIHQFIQPEGIKTCCQGNQIQKLSPDEFRKSDFLKSVKLSILNNSLHDNCINCFNLEKQGFQSTRQESIQSYNNYSPENLPSDEIEYLDLRYSNQCNFSCRTCEPAFSSKIVHEIDNNSILRKYYTNNAKLNSYESISSELQSILPKVKKINFTGGEPLLIKDNLKIFETLIETGNTKCEILITTNASVLPTHWLNLLSNFSNVHWTISLDGVRSFAEYIRYGSKWSTIKSNITNIMQLKQSIAFNTVLSAYSVLGIDTLVEYFLECKQAAQGPFEHWFHLCVFPAHLHPNVLDENLSKIASKRIENAIKLLSTVGDNPYTSIQTLKNCKTILNMGNDIQKKRFLEFTKELDQIRNQNFDILIQG